MRPPRSRTSDLNPATTVAARRRVIFAPSLMLVVSPTGRAVNSAATMRLSQNILRGVV